MDDAQLLFEAVPLPLMPLDQPVMQDRGIDLAPRLTGMVQRFL